LRDFVIEAGRRLDRRAEEVEPYAKILVDNWFDCPESLADTKPEELANQGIPLRFAKELVAAAARGSRPPARREPGKGKGKGKDSEKGRFFPRRGEDDWRDAGGWAGSGVFRHRIDLWEHDVGFNLRGAVIGEKGRNVHHIQDQTGARLWLRGEPGEPLHVEVTANTAKDLNRAVRLTKDLLGAVHVEYEQWLRHERDQWTQVASTNGKGIQRLDKGKGKTKTKGKGKGKGGKEGKDGRRRELGKGRDCEFREVLDLWESEPGFNLKGKIIGDSGRNVHHIQDQTGARLWLSGDPLQLEVSAGTSGELDQAVQMAKDLIKTVYQNYDEWLQDGGGERDPAEDKGRARRRDHHDDEPPPPKRGRSS